MFVGGHRYLVDSSNYIETEFRVEPEEVWEGGIDKSLFEDFVYAVSIRVARELLDIWTMYQK